MPYMMFGLAVFCIASISLVFSVVQLALAAVCYCYGYYITRLSDA